MRHRLRISASVTALVAAASVCATGAAAAILLAASPAAAQEYNTENDVHAVPSGVVDAAALGKVGAAPPIGAPPPLAVPAAIAAPEPLAIPSPVSEPPPAVEQVADAAPVGGSEEDAVYRRPPQPMIQAAVADAQDPPARLTKVSDVQSKPPSQIGQHVAFPRRSAEAASAFDGYMHAVAAIDAGFKSGQGVAVALKRASAYDARQLEEGMIAYGAMAAMQSPRFVYGVMDMAANPQNRLALIAALQADPNSAARLPGASEASALASGAILREARPVVENGKAIKQASYDVQHQGWSIAKAADQTGRLAEAKAASQVRAPAHEGDIARILTQVTTVGGENGRDGATSPVIDHSLALAALSILDGAEGSDEPRLEQVVSESISADCLKMAKLNLFQCLSVAGPEYEDVYCLGQHAVLDTGQCVAGGASPTESMLLSQAPRMSRRPE